MQPLQPGGDAPRHPEMQSLMDGGGMLAAQGWGLNFMLEKCQFFHPATQNMALVQPDQLN